jgi:hypothetical protein
MPVHASGNPVLALVVVEDAVPDAVVVEVDAPPVVDEVAPPFPLEEVPPAPVPFLVEHAKSRLEINAHASGRITTSP